MAALELYLIRHGMAAERGDEYPDDSKRPLTSGGTSRARITVIAPPACSGSRSARPHVRAHPPTAQAIRCDHPQPARGPSDPKPAAAEPVAAAATAAAPPGTAAPAELPPDSLLVVVTVVGTLLTFLRRRR